MPLFVYVILGQGTFGVVPIFTAVSAAAVNMGVEINLFVTLLRSAHRDNILLL